MSDEMIMQCDTAIDAGKELVKLLQPGDVVYIKGSQSMRMERAIAMILGKNHPPESVLVRQEQEWLAR
jgi:UDP-N-acetylmuramyl pentapeptide synthase